MLKEFRKIFVHSGAKIHGLGGSKIDFIGILLAMVGLVGSFCVPVRGIISFC